MKAANKIIIIIIIIIP
jgi:hypothetical protein